MERIRRITDDELADISEAWENPQVDTRRYIQTATRVFEVSRRLYLAHKREGGLCQQHHGRYYIA